MRKKEVPALSDLVPMEKWSCPDCERAAIGSVLLDGQGLADTLCALLADSDYYDPRNRKVAETIRNMLALAQPIDAQTVARKMRESIHEVGGPAYFAQLIRDAGASSSLAYNCQEVLDASAIRSMLQAMYSGMGADIDPIEMRDALCRAADIAKARGSSVRNIHAVAVDEVEFIEARIRDGNRVNGVPTGWPLYNWHTGGLTPCEVTLIAARPSVGKTAFGLQLALDVARQGFRVLFVSLEMSEAALMHRILSNATGIEAKTIRCGGLNLTQLGHIHDARDQLDGLPLEVVDKAGLRMRDIHVLAKRLPERQAVVILDYIGLVKPEDHKIPREQQVARISAAIKAAAKDTCIPWVVLSQLRRLDAKTRSNPKPTLQDLRESGSLEQDADTVILLHREDYGTQTPGVVSPLEVIIGKQRNGPTGTIAMEYHRDTQRIREA